MERIETQQQADDVVGSIDWEHAFVREIVVRSPSYREDDGAVVAPDSLPTVDVVVATPSDVAGGLRLTLEDAEGLALWFTVDVELSVVVAHSYVEVRFSREQSGIRCQRLLVERVPEYWGSDYLLVPSLSDQ